MIKNTNILGAIIGDIVGSPYEFHNILTKDFPLFTKDCSYTDDTICTVAVMDAILQGADYGDMLRAWCRKYPHPMGSYGGRFAQWIHDDTMPAYDSFGNGSAMRVSPVAFAFFREYDVMLQEAAATAMVSHNHPEGVRGAVITAATMWMGLHGYTKKEILDQEKRCLAIVDGMHLEGYQLPHTTTYYRKHHTFDETCQGTLPQALRCFQESTDFEDAIRLAVSIGGDSDTLGAITGSIAAAHYGVPDDLASMALSYLPAEMVRVIETFDAYLENLMKI